MPSFLVTALNDDFICFNRAERQVVRQQKNMTYTAAVFTIRDRMNLEELTHQRIMYCQFRVRNFL